MCLAIKMLRGDIFIQRPIYIISVNTAKVITWK